MKKLSTLLEALITQL